MIPDFESYSDEDLDAAREALDAETARRTLRSRIPTDVGEFAAKYVAAGGSKDDILAAISEAVPDSTADESFDQSGESFDQSDESADTAV